MLRSLTNEERRHIFMHRLSSNQKRELEVFMSREHGAKAPNQLTLSTAKSAKWSREVHPVSKRPKALKLPKVRQRTTGWKPTPRSHSQGIGLNLRGYEAYVFVDWLLLKWKKLKSLEEAIDTHILLTSFVEQVRMNQCLDIKKRILFALDSALQEHSTVCADKANLCFKIQVPSTHWTGRQLMTPTFQMHELDLLADSWLKLREARGHSSGRVKVGGRGMLYRMTPAEMDQTWARVRGVYLQIKRQRGHNVEEAEKKLETMVTQRAPFRERVWRSWNLVMMRRAERQQRWGSHAGLVKWWWLGKWNRSKFFGPETWNEEWLFCWNQFYLEIDSNIAVCSGPFVLVSLQTCYSLEVSWTRRYQESKARCNQNHQNLRERRCMMFEDRLMKHQMRQQQRHEKIRKSLEELLVRWDRSHGPLQKVRCLERTWPPKKGARWPEYPILIFLHL